MWSSEGPSPKSGGGSTNLGCAGGEDGAASHWGSFARLGGKGPIRPGVSFRSLSLSSSSPY